MRVLCVYLGLAGLAMAAIAIAGGGSFDRIIGTLGVLQTVVALRQLRSGVVASETELRIRNRLRRIRISHAEIEHVEAGPAIGFPIYHLGTPASIATATTSSRSVRLDVSLALPSGGEAMMPYPRLVADVLRRWIDAHGDHASAAASS